jgi:hypothetical protein
MSIMLMPHIFTDSKIINDNVWTTQVNFKQDGNIMNSKDVMRWMEASQLISR